MRWHLAGLSLLAGLSFAACQTEPTTGHNVALLYGITTYDSQDPDGSVPGSANLLFPVKDVESLAPLLSTSSGGVFSTVTTRVNGEATKDQIKADIATAASQLDADSELLFYYSGHGDQGVTTGVGGIDGHSFIIPFGAYSHHTNPIVDSSLLITEDELRDLLSGLPTKKIVVILDCCFSGGFLKMTGGSDGVPQDTSAYYQALWKAFLAGTNPSAGTELAAWYNEASTGQTDALASWNKALASGSGFAADQAQLLTAAGALESSYDDPTHLHGAFTYWLLQAKDHGDSDGNGYVTVSEAYRYTFENLQNSWNGVWGAVGAGTLSSSTAFLPHLSPGSADYLLFKK